MKDKRPSFQFYPGDFLSDHNVIGMSMEERGAYITLLCICWDQGHLPNDEKALARYLNGTSMDLVFVKGCFTEKDGVLVHKRLVEERQKQDNYKKRCSKGGRQSQKNQKDKKSLASGIEVPCNTSSPSSSSSSSLSSKHKDKTLEQAPKKKTNPDLKICIDYYHDQFFQIHGQKPLINGKHAKLMEPIVKHYGKDQTVALLDRFFASDDKFIVEAGHSVEIFNGTLSKIISGKEHKKPTKFQKGADRLKSWSDKNKTTKGFLE